MLAVIQAERRAGRDYNAVREIETACLSRIGLPFSVVRRSSPEELVALIHRSGDAHTRSILLADLLLEDAVIMQEAGKAIEAVRDQVQAFCLLAESIHVLSPDDARLYQAKLDALAASLAALDGGPYLDQKLSAYHRTIIKT